MIGREIKTALGLAGVAVERLGRIANALELLAGAHLVTLTKEQRVAADRLIARLESDREQR